LRPVQPDRDTSLSTGAERAEPAQADSDRRALRKDGLHLAAAAGAAAGDETARELQDRESGLLALITSARHEVRSPLQSIQGFADLLSAESYGTLGDDQRVFVEHIVQGSVDLSRVLDACFDLVQAELSRSEVAPGALPFRRALEDAVTLARSATDLTVDMRLGTVPADLTILADSYGLAKAVGAIFTALAPVTGSPMLISAALRDGQVEVVFGAELSEVRSTWRSVQELSRNAPSARALLWLRLASALLNQGGARLCASEGYDRIRILLPTPSGG